MGRRTHGKELFPPSPKGVAEVLPCVAAGCRCGGQGGGAQCVALLLGSAANAAAAVDGDLPSYRVVRIVCVASTKNACQLEARVREALEGAATAEPARHSAPPRIRTFAMNDWCQPDEEVDIARELASPLEAVDISVREAVAAVAAGDGCREGGDAAGRTAAVLLHCDLGINRGPTLTLSFLVRSCGLSLREAYRRVLAVRAFIDPLPAYRRGLRNLEVECQGAVAEGADIGASSGSGASVCNSEPFAMHMSELLRVVREGGEVLVGSETWQAALPPGVEDEAAAVDGENDAGETLEAAVAEAGSGADSEASDSDSDSEEATDGWEGGDDVAGALGSKALRRRAQKAESTRAARLEEARLERAFSLRDAAIRALLLEAAPAAVGVHSSA
eukprot:TRINITY_DN37095_c0_g1_i1.p1 TRINITY_DN37095_c0_g1~~TRINITY_DN37095_c0_g1_i1.p1  ORF type:complete len:389 (-),score=116.76 TRINITY_DN37095_c0_g1_i1:202-1368(-)